MHLNQDECKEDLTKIVPSKTPQSNLKINTLQNEKKEMTEMDIIK